MTVSSLRVGWFALMVVLGRRVADKVPAGHGRRASFQRLASRLTPLAAGWELILLDSSGSGGRKVPGGPVDSPLWLAG